MKKLITVAALFAGFSLAGNAQAITVDGTFNLDEWDGYYSEDDGVGGGGYIGPGYGGQAFDVEYLGLKSEGGLVYFGLQTGFNLKNGVTYNGDYFRPGDFALDVNQDSIYDYAIDFSINSSNIPTFSLYSVSAWEDVMYPQHGIANPFQYSSGDLVATFSGAYGSGYYSNNEDGGKSYVLEGSFDLGLLALSSGGDLALHWTMECGNDYLRTTAAASVPEPSTLLLLGSGIAGAFFARKRLKR